MPTHAKDSRKKTKVSHAKAEVVSEVDMGPMFLEANILRYLNKLPEEMEGMPIDQLALQIGTYAVQANKSRREVNHHAAYVLAFAWACGTVLTIAKSKIAHGEFSDWLKLNIGNTQIGVDTARRYMRLARNFATVDDLLLRCNGLRQAYIACGILPEPPEPDKLADGDRDEVARKTLLKSVASLDSRLRRFSAGKVRLDDKTKDNLRSAKIEIDGLFKSLLGLNEKRHM